MTAMKTLITSHRSLLTILRSRSASILIALALGAFALSPRVRAVTPAPDGGYAGGNTAEGQNALLSLTTGAFNTAVGFLSLRSNTTGQLNTAIGAGTLLANTADQNTATGALALLSNTTGAGNTANGVNTLFHNTTGDSNTAIGGDALVTNTTGSAYTALGIDVLRNNVDGNFNTGVGINALFQNTASNNTAVGFDALFSNTTGNGNVAIGSSALSSSSAVGVDSPDGANVAIGPAALQNTNGTGSFSGGGNNAVGHDALQGNTTGFANNAFGFKALFSNTIGVENTAFGDQALLASTTGGGNTAVGALALSNNTTGITNTALGFNVTTADNVIVIGTNVGGQNVDHGCFIGEIFGQTSSGGTAVFIDSNGRLGTATSSRRFKEGIKPMEQASEALFALKPVAFRYKKQIDPAGTPQLGLVAEDVEKVNPDLVVRDKEGKPYSVRYDQVNAMLLNEFLKEHRKVEELNSTVAIELATIADLKSTTAQQQKGLQILTAQLREQALETSKPATQLVNNP
jgi:hypothetical protein